MKNINTGETEDMFKTSGDWKEHLTRCQKAAGTHIPNTIKV